MLLFNAGSSNVKVRVYPQPPAKLPAPQVTWPVPPLFSFLVQAGSVSEAERYRVFNMGIGMVLVIEPKRLSRVEAVFCGTANQTGVQNDIARMGWLAGGYPESVATNGIGQQCPSGMAATEHAARAIMAGEGEIYIASGVEDMQKVIECAERTGKRGE